MFNVKMHYIKLIVNLLENSNTDTVEAFYNALRNMNERSEHRGLSKTNHRIDKKNQ